MIRPPRRVGAAAGFAVAGVGLGAALERRLVGRTRRRPDPQAREPFGSLHGPACTVPADDGLHLRVEVVGPDDAAVSVVFAHGFTLNMDCWHYQRKHLADVGRLVFYDQRSHGSSARSPREHATIDQLGRDLYRVLEATGPHRSVVVVGHSMGGMSAMALADAHPELFGSLVRGVALVGTAPGRVGETVLGIPAVAGRLLRPLAPGAFRLVDRQATLLERGRRSGSDLGYLLVRRFAFGDGATPSLVAFMERMIASTPLEVMADFFPTFVDHDKLAALDVLRGVPTLVLVGERDLMTPPDHSREIAAAVPSADLVVLAGAGHMVMLERPALVNLHLRALIRRAGQQAPAAASA